MLVFNNKREITLKLCRDKEEARGAYYTSCNLI